MPNRELAAEEESGAETEVESGANPAVDEMEKENERVGGETPVSPVSTLSQRESKLQKLKRSLSFKAKGLRSKSAENFFQRTSSETKLQVELLPGVSSSTGQLPVSESQTSTPTRTQRQAENRTHSFLEYIFKKPTFCDTCNHMIVGTNAKLGLRCKACKMSIHHKCIDGVEQQRCMGKLPKGFRRYYSSPLLINEQYGCIKEVMPIACGSKIDPVYETLRFGTSLAQRTKKSGSGSGSDSPQRNSASDLAEVPEEGADAPHGLSSLSRKYSDSVFGSLENGHENIMREERKPSSSLGKIADRVGYFPATFVQKVMTGEKVFRCSKPFTGSKEGQINVKENQICVDKGEEINGFIKVRSGKKKGFVPLDILVNI
ncbi:SH3 and cysteine-rich domain-containing protein isoform X2 [Scyliorhinus canicula]|uniref:SH3 and cysteine-rich domain-containing protein isoform X2 n=1 Tax=Scyliorhinus canicula TaxID=7830 RepID=UPI0018F5ACE1|nr:SH3 and cysteine-rich domain-containing protein isoform X2 [Scyliorhinus canicula]